MYGLDICTGSGIGSWALRKIIPGYQTLCYIEKDSYRQALLLSRIADGLICDAPLWDDLTTFNATTLSGMVDILAAGIQCQPYSHAGNRLGARDDRNLWPATRRVIRDCRPRYVMLENVPAILTFEYFGTILRQLANLGYLFEWDIVSAAEMGATQIRNRLWLLAYRSGERWTDVADADGLGESSGIEQTGRQARADSRGRGKRGAVANTEEQPKRSRLRSSGKRAQRRTRSGNEGKSLADAGCSRRRKVSGRTSRYEGETARRSSAHDKQSHRRGQSLADSEGERIQGDRPGRFEEPSTSTGSSLFRRDGIGLYPPSPSESGEWRRIIAERPELEPAIRRVADGMAHRMDELAASEDRYSNRGRRLETCGLGWVPQVLAAWLKFEEEIDDQANQ